MESLFSKRGLAALSALPKAKTLFAFDFDGTLSPIAQSRSDAKFARSTERLLRKLSELAPVAVISGRSLVDLMTRVTQGRIHLIGNHGMEGASDNAVLVDAERTCAKWLEQLNDCSWSPGIEVENKAFSLSIHYRGASDEKAARAEVLGIVTGLIPMARILDGDAVINVLPLNAPHKGNAILELGRRLEAEHMFYIGDDFTDEDAFQALWHHEQALTVRVGECRGSKAKYYIDSQHEMDQVLGLLVELSKKKSRPQRVQRESKSRR